MPADIRTFFGGKVPPASQEKTGGKKDTSSTKKKGRAARRVIEDSESDEAPAKKESPKKAAPKPKKRDPSPIGKETSTAEFFASKNKPKRSEPAKTRPSKPATQPARASTPSKPSANGKSVQPKRPPKAYVEIKNNDEDFFDDFDGGDDIFTADYKKKKDDYIEVDSDDEPLVRPKRKVLGKEEQHKPNQSHEDRTTRDVDMRDVDSDDILTAESKERILVDRRAKNKVAATAGRKRKSLELDEEDEDEEPEPKKGRARKSDATKKSPAKKKMRKAGEPENPDIQAIFDSIPTVRPPTPPPQGSKKFDFRAHASNTGPPPAAGLKEIPQGEENCLAGLTFVLTGLLETMERTQAQDLIKRYGGKVTAKPSTKTSYVILGSDAGPKKLETIQKNNLKTINEDGLFELIRRLPANGGSGKAAEQAREKREKEEQKIKEAAAEMEKEDRARQVAEAARKAKQATSLAPTAGNKARPAEPSVDSRLWTVKYAPTNLNQICGNKMQVEKLQRWLRNFPKSQRTGFKLAGADASGTFRAVMIHGPPGIGKTTAAHLIAQLEGYDVVEMNASDTRSKKLLENGLKGVLATTSLLGYFAGDGKEVDTSKKKLVLIMDEVDGMSAGDRGGVGALASVCKKTQIPMILICNDRRLPKMKPFDFITFDLPFRRPTTDQIRSRIATICFRENLKLPPQVINALIEGSSADIRQIVNMISTVKLDQMSEERTMGYDESKAMSKAWEKHVVLKPWDVIGKILGGGMFAESSKSTLNEKIELYFNDLEFSFLFLQENYLGTTPIPTLKYSGREKNLKYLELVDKAAESISDGDLVDRMVHGSQQQWSLLPTHAVFSFVRPASFVAGSLAGHRTGFPQWLGKNSSQAKLTRMVKEIQGHMRLRSSGDRHQIRQEYMPVLWTQMVRKLELEGKEMVPGVIDLMDSYFLTKDDFDAIMELGVGPMDMERVKLESQTKATFTRLYNQQSHPLPFMKASNVIAPKRQAKEKPDLEEALEESDEGEVVDEVKDEDDEMDISKDKYVKQPKKKATAKSTASKSKKRGKAADDKDSDSEDVKPKKGRGAGKSGPGKGKTGPARRGKGRK